MFVCRRKDAAVYRAMLHSGDLYQDVRHSHARQGEHDDVPSGGRPWQHTAEQDDEQGDHKHEHGGGQVRIIIDPIYERRMSLHWTLYIHAASQRLESE